MTQLVSDHLLLQSHSNLEGRAALVTGAGIGIGRAVAEALAAAGATVGVHCHRSRAEAEEVVAGIQQRGGKATLLEADLSVPHDAAYVQTLNPSAWASTMCSIAMTRALTLSAVRSSRQLACRWWPS